MDKTIANKIVDFIFNETELNTIVCDASGTIVAAKIVSRVGSQHDGARKMLWEKLESIIVTAEEEENSGGRLKMGVNLPIVYKKNGLVVLGLTGIPQLQSPSPKLLQVSFAKSWRRQRVIECYLLKPSKLMIRSQPLPLLLKN